MLDIYVDGDACPVKTEVYRVAGRRDLKVFVVAHTRIRVPDGARVESVRVKPGFGAADDWIAEHIGPDDVAVTSDIPLADRCLKRGARVVSPQGREFTPDSIGDAVAIRDLMEHLRQMGEVTRGPAPFAAADRSRFIGRLEEIVAAVRRARTPSGSPSREEPPPGSPPAPRPSPE
jgi:hypothetical protein